MGRLDRLLLLWTCWGLLFGGYGFDGLPQALEVPGDQQKGVEKALNSSMSNQRNAATNLSFEELFS